MRSREYHVAMATNPEGAMWSKTFPKSCLSHTYTQTCEEKSDTEIIEEYLFCKLCSFY